MGAPRSRTPNEPGARDIAGALYPDVGSVDWIPSDDADVFRLSLTSGREPRILKMAAHGIRAVWRETGASPAMRRLGIPEVLEFEHTSDDLPDLGIDFHVTVELAHPQQASRALADLWTSEPAQALDVAHWLGDCTGRMWPTGWATARAECGPLAGRLHGQNRVPRLAPGAASEQPRTVHRDRHGLAGAAVREAPGLPGLPSVGTHIHRSRERGVEPPGSVR